MVSTRRSCKKVNSFNIVDKKQEHEIEEKRSSTIMKHQGTKKRKGNKPTRITKKDILQNSIGNNQNTVNTTIKPLNDQYNKKIYFGFNDEISYINKIIENLLNSSEAGSLILCGDAGIGKTTLINMCLESFPVLTGCFDKNYNNLKVSIFKLDGNIHGKDDLATIRLIGRRLNNFLNNQQVACNLDRNGEGEDEDEIYRKVDDIDLTERVNNSIPKIMSQFRNLTENYSNFRSIIILDNFEIFCRRQQTLLYNLLDITQHGRSILVIGITRRLDYLELLEKRVRSRLTQRIVHLLSPFNDLNSYKKYFDSRVKLLCEDHPDLKKNFDANQSLIENELAKSFAINRNFDELNRIILEYSFHMPPDEVALAKINGNNDEYNSEDFKLKTNLPTTISDPKILSLSRLKKNDLILLIIVIRHLRSQDLKVFTCTQLYNWSIEFSLVRKNRLSLVIKSVYNLIESDLVINEIECCRRKASKQYIVCLNKWTKLVPNISESHLKQFLKEYGDKLPQSIKKLL